MNYIVFDIETTEPIGAGGVMDLNIAVISVYNSKDDSMQTYTEENLGEMWQAFEETDALIGYNTEHFDIPLLNKYYAGDLTTIKSIDLMVYIKNSLGRRPKLDDVLNATLGTKKIAHGLQAVEWWKEGKKEKVIKYCESDTDLTHKLFKFIQKNKYVKLKDFKGEIQRIDIDTSDWEEKSDTALTHSMGF